VAKLRWTEEAATWLEDIHDYISLDNPSAAQSVVRGIYDRVQVLAEFPRIGHVHQDVPEGEVRILLYGHYRVAYLLHEDEVVEILGVFHGALDIERYLK